MMKRRLLFGSVASVAVIALLLVSGFAGAGSVEKLNDPGVTGSFQMSAVTRVVQLSFAREGRVAVFEVTVSGSGVLSVDVADYNPSTFPDYWRATIVFYRRFGVSADRVSDVAESNVGIPGTGTGWGPYSGRVDMMVAAPYKCLVLVSYEYGVNVWTAGMLVRFFYSGPAMIVTGPRIGF